MLEMAVTGNGICENVTLAREASVLGHYENAEVYYEGSLQMISQLIIMIQEPTRKNKWQQVKPLYKAQTTRLNCLPFRCREKSPWNTNKSSPLKTSSKRCASRRASTCLSVCVARRYATNLSKITIHSPKTTRTCGHRRRPSITATWLGKNSFPTLKKTLTVPVFQEQRPQDEARQYTQIRSEACRCVARQFVEHRPKVGNNTHHAPVDGEDRPAVVLEVRTVRGRQQNRPRA